MARTQIQSVTPGGPAHQAGVRPGETLVAINGHPIVDVLDYKYYSYDPDLTLTLRTEAGERTVELSKDVGEDLGLEFATYLMDRARSCANHCVFCFVDQMPKGMRDTLYFKDDDARLSFLMGNYITLTNLTEREAQRIIDLRISPINVSVQATEPQLRRTLLGNKDAARSLDYIKAFCKAGITTPGVSLFSSSQAFNCPSCSGVPENGTVEKCLIVSLLKVFHGGSGPCPYASIIPEGCYKLNK